jgi:hypothetical protein
MGVVSTGKHFIRASCLLPTRCLFDRENDIQLGGGKLIVTAYRGDRLSQLLIGESIVNNNRQSAVERPGVSLLAIWLCQALVPNLTIRYRDQAHSYSSASALTPPQAP